MPHKSTKVNILGLDPSMNNWGIAKATWDERDGLLIRKVDVIHPTAMPGKARKNAKDVYHAEQLVMRLGPYLDDVDIVVAEVPVGSQSAAAMKGYGMCIAIMAMVNQSIERPAIQVSPQDVKLVVNNPEATKQDMVEWAVDLHPEAEWPTYKRDNVHYVSVTKAEHMADAIAAIYAGSYTKQFELYMNQIIGNKQ